MKRPVIVLVILAALIAVIFGRLIFSSRLLAGNFGDVYQHYYPLRHLTAEHIISGKMPLWNPYIFAGEPLLANPQSAVFYPASLMFYVLPLVPAFNYFQAAHLLLGGFFFFLLLKFYGSSNTASLTGAVTFAFSSFLLYKIPQGHPAELSGYVWLPLIMLFTEKLSRVPSPRSTALLAAALCFQFLSGHIFPVYISAIFLLVYVSYGRLLNFKYILSACALAMLVSAVQLLPSSELAQVSETDNWMRLVNGYSLKLSYLVNFVFPNHYGNVIDKTFVFPANPSFFFENHALYMGIIPFALGVLGAFFAFRSRRYFYVLLLAAGLALAVGFNDPLYSALYGIFPGFNFLRAPSRFIFLTLVSLIVLGAAAWSRYFKNLGIAAKLLIFTAVAADLFLWGHRFVYPENIDIYRRVSSVSEVVDPMYRIMTEPGKIMPNKSMLYHHFNLNGYEAVFLRDFVRYLGIQEKRSFDSTGICRSDLYSPLAGAFSVKYDITTVEKKELELASARGVVPMVYERKNPLPRLFFARRLKFYESEDFKEQMEYLSTVKTGPDQELMFERNRLPREVRDTIEHYTNTGAVLSYKCQSDRIEAEVLLKGPGTLVFSEIFYSGWKAASRAGSFPILRGHKIFRALALPAGDYTQAGRLILYYLPVSFQFGLIVTMISAVIMIFLFASQGFIRKRS